MHGMSKDAPDLQAAGNFGCPRSLRPPAMYLNEPRAAAAADKQAGPLGPTDPGRREAIIRTHFAAQLNAH